MNIKKFFERARDAGLSSCQLRTASSSSIAVSLFHGEIESFNVENDSTTFAYGIYEGKYGSCITEKLDASSIDFIIEGIKNSAKISERDDCLDVFPGSEKYKKKTFFNKKLSQTELSKKIELIKDVEKLLFESGKDVAEIEDVSYFESIGQDCLYNSYGLKLSNKTNYFGIVASIMLKRGEETKTSRKVFIGTDLDKFDKNKFVKQIYEEGIKKFGGSPCKAKQYPTLLDRDVFGDLIAYFLSANSSIAVQKNSSFLIGMEGKEVASKKVSIDDVPLLKGPAYTYFDAEGVAKTNQKIVNHGILTSHYYNRETAKKANRETTGHASYGSGKLGISPSNTIVRPSKKSFDDLIKNIKEGVYITEVAGLGMGMNIQSGDFSCQAQGFMIRDGKVAEPLDLITLSGNLLKMLKDVKGLDNRFKENIVGVSCSDALIKRMHIGGK